jgi:hypothetical protein
MSSPCASIQLEIAASFSGISGCQSSSLTCCERGAVEPLMIGYEPFSSVSGHVYLCRLTSNLTC